MPLTPMPKRRGDRGACPLQTISRACGPSPAFLIRGTLRQTLASLCRATFCVFVCPNDTKKVPRAFAELLSDAVCYPAKWLKSSLERLSGNSERAPFHGPKRLHNGRKCTHFGASCYRRTRNPTRQATFQTVSRIGFLGSWQHLAPALRSVDLLRQAQE